MVLTGLIYFTFLLFSLGQLGRVSFFNQEINIYVYEILLFITLATLFVRYRVKPLVTAYKKFPLAFWTLGIFLASYIINLPGYTFFQNGVAFLYFFRLMMYVGYWIYLWYWLRKEKKIHKHLLYAAGMFIVLTIVSSLLQYFLYPDLRNLKYLGWDPHLNRMFGIFFDTSIAAAIFGVIFFFAVTLGRQMIRNKLILYGIIGTFCLFLVLTFSRSGYFAFVFCLLFYWIRQKQFRFTIIFLSFFIFFILVVPKQFGFGVGLARTFSINSRITDYKEGIVLWSKSPIFGIGYNHIRYARGETEISSHAAASFSSSDLIILVSGGIIGLVLFLLTYFKFLAINQYTQLLFTFVGLLSFTDNILLHPFILFLLGGVTILLTNPLSGKSP